MFSNQNFNELLNKYNKMFFFALYRHIELANLSGARFVFTITKSGAVPQGKIAFNNLQVRLLFLNFVLLK